MEPRYNEPLYSKVLGKTNDFLHPAGSKIYGKGPLYNETSIKRTTFCHKVPWPYVKLRFHFVVLNAKEIWCTSNFLTCLAVYCTNVSPFGLIQCTNFTKFKINTWRKNCIVSNLCNNTGKFDLITLFKFVSCCFSHHLIYYCLIQNHQQPLNQQVSSI